MGKLRRCELSQLSQVSVSQERKKQKNKPPIPGGRSHKNLFMAKLRQRQSRQLRSPRNPRQVLRVTAAVHAAIRFYTQLTGSNIVPAEYSCKTKIGTFIIRSENNHPGWWRLWIDGYLLGEYPSPEAAADNVYKQSTGFKQWDSLSSVSEPTDLSMWKKVFSK